MGVLAQQPGLSQRPRNAKRFPDCRGGGAFGLSAPSPQRRLNMDLGAAPPRSRW